MMWLCHRRGRGRGRLRHRVDPSSNFPTPRAYQGAYGGGADAFVTKLSPAGNTLTYSTYLGGDDDDWAMASPWTPPGPPTSPGKPSPPISPPRRPIRGLMGGNPDAFVTKLSPAGNALAYSTYLGGSSDDDGRGIAVDPAGAAYVTGVTYSSNFPTPGAYQGALARL